jgi:DNA helicase II / ATP-dependent DNA helicase PcrA
LANLIQLYLMSFELQYLWNKVGFKPNKKQEDAIRHIDGPLFLTAGPGSGKTRVILWRTVNLIVFHNVDPKNIFLATFTEKAALQLKDGLRSLLGLVTNETGRPFDISGMSIGTVHSICQEILIDRNRRFTKEEQRSVAPILLDELVQYFKIYNRRFWNELLTAGGFIGKEDPETNEMEAQKAINSFFVGREFYSRHEAVRNIISIFNRFSEENLDPDEISPEDEFIQRLLLMYSYYVKSHKANKIQTVDFSLLQQIAYQKVKAFEGSKDVYEYIIIDEYQDTNSIQEQIYFTLSEKCKNICVVGDDDQALYRFRGATVENLVEFEDRCVKYLGIKPKRIDLDTNYRSKKKIVDFYTEFIKQTDWRKSNGKDFYRVNDKNIHPHNQEDFPAVITTTCDSKQDVLNELARFVYNLKQKGRIADYNQVAVLFPSLTYQGAKNSSVSELENALNRLGIPVFAPRAGRFLDVPEAQLVFGLLFHVLGRPSHQGSASQGLQQFRNWQLNALSEASKVIASDSFLKEYITDRQNEIKEILSDYEILMKVVTRNKWNLKKPFILDMLRELSTASGLSRKCRTTLQKRAFVEMLKKKQLAKEPATLNYVINRVTSVDWSILDLFYQLNGFGHFQQLYELAEDGTDEGPVCNLGLITQYLARFMEEYSPIITASFINENKFVNTFVGSYLYAIYRLGESEYEDADDPFPRGRVPFLTIHQSKGLEFPYVIMGNINKVDRPANKTEIIIRELLQKEGEPLDRISNFDNMRMFYVALSRARLMTIIPRWKRQHKSQAFKNMFDANIYPELNSLNWSDLSAIQLEEEELGKSYSYTGDYLNYQQCPRKYMIFKKYGFVPSRSQTMFFGSLVHQTIEDLHHLLIAERKKKEEKV